MTASCKGDGASASVPRIGVLRGEENYEKCRNYRKYPKSKLRKENSQLVSAATQLSI